MIEQLVMADKSHTIDILFTDSDIHHSPRIGSMVTDKVPVFNGCCKVVSKNYSNFNFAALTECFIFDQ